MLFVEGVRTTRLAAALLLAVTACVPAPVAPSASPAVRAAWQQWNCVSAVGSSPDAKDEFAEQPGPVWDTDFSKHCVPLSEFLISIPVPDGIPPIDRPEFYEFARAGAWLRPQEPVIAVVAGDDARAYPLQILIWHEIVNDTVGGRPLAVTY